MERVRQVERVTRREIKVVLVAVLVLVVAVPSVLIVFSRTETFIFSKNLHVTDFVRSDEAYVANVLWGFRDIGHIYVRIEKPTPNSSRRPIVFSISHVDGTELDTLTLRFTADPYVTSLFLKAASYEWSEAEFHRDGAGILFSVKDLGWYGTGTITLDFLLDPDPQSSVFGLTIDFSMHYSGFIRLTSLKGHSFLSTQLGNPG
jgi:hypothetical protein